MIQTANTNHQTIAVAVAVDHLKTQLMKVLRKKMDAMFLIKNAVIIKFYLKNAVQLKLRAVNFFLYYVGF